MATLKDEITMKMTEKLLPSKDKTSRKRKREPQCWKKNKAAILREKGEGYTSYLGKDIPKKTPNLGMLCNAVCPFQCNKNFSNEQREQIFADFYKLDVNAKNAFLSNCILMVKLQRQRKDASKHKSSSFHYVVKNECRTVRVCKTALAAIFNIGRGKIDHIQKFIKAGHKIPPPDCRGKHTNRPHRINSEVLDYIEDHIRSFPYEESHYFQTDNAHKKYLSPFLSLKKMYELYLDVVIVNDKPEHFTVPEATYRHIFSSKFNLSFGRSRNYACSICELGNINETHVANYQQAFDMQKFDRELPKQRSDVAYLTFDLQQTMPLPKLSVSNAFYLRQLQFYNLGVRIVTELEDAAHFFTWTENIASRGSNEVASSLLTFLEFDKSLKSKDHLIIWSDSCLDLNENSTLLFLYQYLIFKGYFNVIEHKFSEVGHSSLDNDQDFGRIEKNVRKHETVFLPDQYREIILNSGRNHRVTDMTPHFRNFKNLQNKLKLINRKKNVLNENVAFREKMKWIRVDQFGSYMYKDCYDPNTPFKKVELTKQSRNVTKGVCVGDFELERTTNAGIKLAVEKIENLERQLPFIDSEYRFFYESLIQKEKQKHFPYL